uniref:CNH domain-containing protein n=1 Tax=Macrostomum lignano TaxID=282301 RepID=A0A1I8H4P6_9PLAT
TACQRQLQSASAILQVAERQEAALAAWDSLIDRLQQVAEQRRTRLRAASRPALSETMATAMQQAADQLRAALDSGDLRAAAAARDRLATTEEAALAAVTVAESSLTQQLAPPPPQLNKHLLEVEFANLFDEAEYLYRGFRGHPSGTLRRHHKTDRRRKFESVRATDLTVVTLGDQTRHGRRPMWRGPETGLRWPTQDEEENASQTAVDFESLEAGSLPASNRSPWRPLPSTVLYCKSPNSRQLLVLESVSGCHLATVELTAALPHLVERLAYWPAKQQLLLSNGKSVLQCDLTGVCHRRLDGFRDATDVCLDLNGDRLLVLESRLGCVFVYGLEKFAPLQTLGPFGRGLHSMCWVSGATGQSLPALLLTDRLGPIRIFAGSNKLVPIRELTPELHTAAAEAATPSWPSSFTAAAVSPAGDQVYIATPSSGIFCLPYSRLLNNQDEQESGVSSTGFELLISAAELNHRAPAGMEILQLTSACDNAGLEQSAAGFELLVCSGDASEIDVFHLTTTAVQLDYVDEGDGGFNPM